MAKSKKRRSKRSGLRGSTASCAGTKHGGKLKKGYKWKRGSHCPVRAKG